jgi:Kef-type K+ transport system membrane component KefB
MDAAGFARKPMHAVSVIAALALILVLAKVLGDLFERARQPTVLGELLAGVIVGNLGLLGFHELDFLRTDEVLAFLAELGVIILLFQVGLESNINQMLRVGISSLLVAIVGVVTPMALGYLTARLLLPDASVFVHIFIGAVLTATSVGITARVLGDLGKVQSVEGRIILGAAVIDDVLGLIVLAVVRGMIEAAGAPGGGLDAAGILLIIAKSMIFLGGAIAVGPWVSRRLFRVASLLHIRGLLLALALAFCFGASALAGAVGLAAIVGAFAAGLILDEVSFRPLRGREPHGLEEQVGPIAAFLVPVFFVITGAKVDLRAFADPGTLWLAAALTFAAVIGKQVCGLAAIGRGLDRLSIGLGMIPRGEVGLIFAVVGASLKLPDGTPVIDAHTNAAVVVMVFATTLLTPPVLSWSLGRRSSS